MRNEARDATIVLSTGEPAGIGPDVCLALAREPWPVRLVAVGDCDVLRARAAQLALPVSLQPVSELGDATTHRPDNLQVLHVAAPNPVRAGHLDAGNARYVLKALEMCAAACMDGGADALVTAPVHKGIVNDAGILFSGHTEYLAALTGSELPVMMLCAGTLRVALATTHLPLRDVPEAITPAGLTQVLRILHHDLTRVFAIEAPAIAVCGLNPHAGEGGHLGHEDLAVIAPVIERLRGEGLNLSGPLPADTAFTPRVLDTADAVLAMYHDQGLPVLKYAGFGDAINITLGLPIVRTSVDHGTALDLSASGRADPGSMRAATALAIDLVSAR